jgi:hypothetical protein
MLPSITADNLENIAEEFYENYCPNYLLNPEQKYSFPVVKIKEWLGLKLWYADLPDNCFGRLYLKDSTATIYDSSKYPIIEKYENKSIPRGSILLNHKYYYQADKCDDVITFCHELVHWALHQSYFILLHMLDDGFEAMNCSFNLPNFDGTMTIAEKAYWIAEGQANDLSIRLAMPKHLVEEAMAEYENNTKGIIHDGLYYQAMVENFSLIFNVPPKIVKRRLRQLGYDFADGICVIVDDCQYHPFTFALGALKENETFIIKKTHFEQLLCESQDFDELIKSRIFVYTGYAVCFNDVKYIKPVLHDNKLTYSLTEYSLEHADECCLKFESCYRFPISEQYSFNVHDFLCKLADGNYGHYDNDMNVVLSQEAKDDFQVYKERKNEQARAMDILANMRIKGIVSFADVFKYHKNRLKLSFSMLSQKTELSEDTIKGYVAPSDSKKYRKVELPNVMVLCNAMNLEYTLAIDMIHKAGYDLNTDTPEDEIYDYLLTITNAPLYIWNEFLTENNLPTLPKH